MQHTEVTSSVISLNPFQGVLYYIPDETEGPFFTQAFHFNYAACFPLVVVGSTTNYEFGAGVKYIFLVYLICFVFRVHYRHDLSHDLYNNAVFYYCLSVPRMWLGVVRSFDRYYAIVWWFMF